MINITDKHNCCGCGACANRCPKQCITMQEDKEGFLYPQVFISDCIDCGLCEKVCHELHPFEEYFPTKVLAAINKKEEVRLASSSGGIFSLLAEKFIREGGVVFGANFDDNWQVKLGYTEFKDGISKFRGSKYVQARTDTAYSDCERFLKENRFVLFSGTPCQIAGLKHFLRKEYDNLLTVDFVCHGTPSPKVWKRYLDETIDAINRQIQSVRFRDKKDEGWKKFRLALEFENEGDTFIVSVPNSENAYMRAFLSNLDLRPSCHDCKAKSGRSGSDITLGDFWGVQNYYPEIDDNKGTSLVMIHTPKGEEVLDMGDIDFIESNYEIAIEHNPAIKASVAPHRNREKFFFELEGSSSIQKLVTDKLNPTLSSRFRTLPSRLKVLVYNILKSLLGGVKNNEYSSSHIDAGFIPNNLIKIDNIADINFRYKKDGWRQYKTKITLKR